MTKFGTYETHERLVERMAQTLGADLTEATQRGEGPSEAERQVLITRCMSCTDPGDCTRFLDHHRDTGQQVNTTPAYCRNKSILEQLTSG